MGKFRYGLVLVCFAVTMLVLTGTVSAETWYVDDGGGAGINFTKIQDAVDVAQDNDTIFVYNGTYNEQVTVNTRLILKGIEYPVVDAGGIMISADGCVIDGFNVTGGPSGIWVRSDYNRIVNNSIYNNEEDGIDLESSDYNTIANNRVFNNSDDGIDLDNSFNNTIINNTVKMNAYNGIELDDSGYNTIANNNVFNNSDDGMDIDNSCNNMLINNTVMINRYTGIDLDYSDHNTIANNSVFNNHADGIYLSDSSSNTIINNTVYGNDDVGISTATKNSSNNHIYHNNLIDNIEEQARDKGANNSWDNGPFIGGNYWSDHECTGNPSNGSQPYYIDGDSIDHYPFGDPIGELPPLPPPVPRTDVNVYKTDWLYTSETYIDHNQTYNFDIGWDVDCWKVKNLDNVTITITTLTDITYTDIWALYNNGSDTSFILPFNHTGENYTWVLPLKDCFTSCINFQLPEKTVQRNPWADMVVNTMSEEGYTQVNVTLIPRTPSLSLDLTINGKIIDFSYPSEFEVGEFFPLYYISFYGDWEDLNQNQSYNFSVLVDEPEVVELWLDKTHGQWDTEYSNTVTLPVSELGSVTVSHDVPVKWEYAATQPQSTQGITIELEEKKSFDTGEGTYPSIMGTHNGTITLNQTITVSKLYTYPCAGTGGHTEYAKFYNDTWSIESQPWDGYQEDGDNIYFNQSFTLVAGETYNYTIRTGSYPQIHHTAALPTANGWINCTEFTDVNGKKLTDWIPAIRLE
jgi:parallel beta-helix repeat protein